MDDNDVKYVFYKAHDGDVIWSVATVPDMLVGAPLFSFDKKTVFNFWTDYPNKLSAGEKELFDAEFPYWRDFYNKQHN